MKDAGKIRNLTGDYSDERIITVSLNFDADSVPVDATVSEVHIYVNGVRVKVLKPHDRTAARMGLMLPNAYPGHQY